MGWGRNPIENRVPAMIDFAAFRLFGTSYPFYKVLMTAISVGMFAFLYGAFKRTRLGLVIQAALTHPQMVGALGHDVPRLFVLVFAIGSALAGLAGVIGGFALLTEPNMAANLGPIVFVVVVVGGLGSIPGAFYASATIEQLLTHELTDQLAQTMQGTDGAEGSDASSGDGSDDPSTQSIFSMGGSSPVVSQMLPQALSDGITQAGGLGIAHQLYLMLARATGLTAPSGSTTQTAPATGTLPAAGTGFGGAQ